VTSLSAGQQAASVGAGGMTAIRRASANRGAGAEPAGGDKLRKKARAVRRPVNMEALGVVARRGW